MTRIATNYCLNILRARKAGWKKRYEQTVQVDLAGRPNHEFSKLERDQLISQILDSVKPDLQEIAIYYFVDGMTQQDAATAAQCSVPTLRKRLRQFIDAARKKLKQIDTDAVFGDMPI
jgi:RNA polymerase sigma factor (sigma-70 family)